MSTDVHEPGKDQELIKAFYIQTQDFLDGFHSCGQDRERQAQRVIADALFLELEGVAELVKGALTLAEREPFQDPKGSCPYQRALRSLCQSGGSKRESGGLDPYLQELEINRRFVKMAPGWRPHHATERGESGRE